MDQGRSNCCLTQRRGRCNTTWTLPQLGRPRPGLGVMCTPVHLRPRPFPGSHTVTPLALPANLGAAPSWEAGSLVEMG